MKKLLFHSFISVLLFLCSCKTKDDFVAINAKYEFLNYFLNLDSPYNMRDCKFIADRDTATYGEPKTLTIDVIKDFPGGIFTADDLEILDRQRKEASTFKLDPSRIKDKIIVKPNQFKHETDENFWVKFLDKYRTYEFSSVSMPVFSKDMNTVFIEVADYGFSQGKRLIGMAFKKQNGKWMFYEQLYYYD